MTKNEEWRCRIHIKTVITKELYLKISLEQGGRERNSDVGMSQKIADLGLEEVVKEMFCAKKTDCLKKARR